MEMTPQNSRLAADVNSNHYWETIGHSIFSREDLRLIKCSGQQVLNNELRTVVGVVDSKSFSTKADLFTTTSLCMSTQGKSCDQLREPGQDGRLSHCQHAGQLHREVLRRARQKGESGN
jgi:hypothetical protein